MKRLLPLLSLLFAFSAAAEVFSMKPEYSRDPIGVKSYPSAPRLAERGTIEPAATLRSAAESVPEELAALREWNDEGRLPIKNGFTRTIGDPIAVRINGAVAMKEGATMMSRGLVSMSDHGTIVWSGSVRVEGAYQVRLHLTNAVIPDGATLWVYGEGQTPAAFGKEMLYQGSLYTPLANGPLVYLEVEIPSPKTAMDGVSFEIRDLVEIASTLRTPQLEPNDASTCLIDATCTAASTFDAIADVRSAIAHLQYMKGGSSFVCTGGLINDKVPAPSFIPYLLTANHCFDTQASASSLLAFFDFKTASCNAASPGFGQSFNGSTLLATNTTSDFTFVRLNSIPGNRTFLGWTTTAPAVGTKLHRVSHPFPDDVNLPLPQRYSNGFVTNAFNPGCSGRPPSNYIYSSGGQGGEYGGSSGGPILIAGGQVVGQLFGACGSAPSAGCDKINNASVDGRFAVTFSSIEQYINTTGTQGCTETSTAMCLNNNRFKVEATWQTSNQSGQANVVKLTSDTGYLWFFSSSNVEVVIKVLNACGINGYWVFAGGLTDVRVTLTVTDTQTGAVKQYTNPQGTPFAPIQDTSAFSTCP